jgi:hypothetical protein
MRGLVTLFIEPPSYYLLNVITEYKLVLVRGLLHLCGVIIN